MLTEYFYKNLNYLVFVFMNNARFLIKVSSAILDFHEKCNEQRRRYPNNEIDMIRFIISNNRPSF